MNADIPKAPIMSLFPIGTPSLQAVLDALARLEHLPPTRRRDLVSALIRIAQSLDRSPSEIPADAVWLRKELSRFNAARVGVSKKTWTNILSNALAALTAAGATKSCFRRTRLNALWQSQWDRLDERNSRIGLGRFMHFCSFNGVGPEEVSDETVSQFADAVKAASIRKNVATSIYQLVVAWNKATANIPGWPQQRLTVPLRRKRFAPKVDELPTSFRDDLGKYLPI
jgi:hypothetical protein